MPKWYKQQLNEVGSVWLEPSAKMDRQLSANNSWEIALLLRAGASRRLLVAALEQRFTLLVSVALMVEYEAVMTRAQHLVASKLSAEDVGILLDAVASVGEPVRPVFLWRPSSREADDDMVLEVAVNGQADVIVTFNRRDFRPATERFGIEVLLPGAAIERLGGIS